MGLIKPESVGCEGIGYNSKQRNRFFQGPEHPVDGSNKEEVENYDFGYIIFNDESFKVPLNNAGHDKGPEKLHCFQLVKFIDEYPKFFYFH